MYYFEIGALLGVFGDFKENEVAIVGAGDEEIWEWEERVSRILLTFIPQSGAALLHDHEAAKIRHFLEKDRLHSGKVIEDHLISENVEGQRGYLIVWFKYIFYFLSIWLDFYKRVVADRVGASGYNVRYQFMRFFNTFLNYLIHFGLILFWIY